MKRFYRAILPMVVILNLIVPIMLISSLFGRANASSLQKLDGVIVINSIFEPFTLMLLGIGLIGLARISRKGLKFKIKGNNKVQRHYYNPNKICKYLDIKDLRIKKNIENTGIAKII